MKLPNQYYLPTMVSVALGAAFGIALIDTIEAIILGRMEVYITTGSITIILLIASLAWLNWRNGLTSSQTPQIETPRIKLQ